MDPSRETAARNGEFDRGVGWQPRAFVFENLLAVMPCYRGFDLI
jgi:hypothetical protein